VAARPAQPPPAAPAAQLPPAPSSGAAAGEDANALGVCDEYDPREPTDYAAVLSGRAAAASVAAAARARAEGAAAARAAADAAAAAAAAAPPKSAFEGPIFGAAAAAAGAAPGVAGKVAKMMAKWGFVEGGGLGRDGAGRATPLEARALGRGRGVIVAAQPQPLAPSRVLLLRHLVARAADPDDLLEEDVRAEAARVSASPVGDVSVIVYQCAPAPAPRGRGARVFVAFQTPAAADAAAAALDGRLFAGRRIRAVAFSETRFAALALAPSAEEVESTALEEDDF
jgi:splicing factor 45